MILLSSRYCAFFSRDSHSIPPTLEPQPEPAEEAEALQGSDEAEYDENYENYDEYQDEYSDEGAPAQASNHITLAFSYTLMNQIRQVSRLEGVSPEDFVMELVAEGVTRRAFEDANRPAPSHLMTRTGYVPPEADGYQAPKLSHHYNMNGNSNQGNGNANGNGNYRRHKRNKNNFQGGNRYNNNGNHNGNHNGNVNGNQKSRFDNRNK